MVLDIRNFPTLAGMPVEVLANESLQFDFGEIRSLADTIRKGTFDHVDTHAKEREQIEQVLYFSSVKSMVGYRAGLGDEYKSSAELQELAAVLHEKYERTKDAEDLHTSIFVEKSCLDLSVENGVPFSLLRSLYECHSRTRSPEDLERVIESLQQVAGLVDDGDPAKLTILHDLVVFLMMRYDLAGAIKDLDQAIESGEHAVRLSNDDDVIAPMLFDNLLEAFHRRFEQSGNMNDLNAAVANGKRAAVLAKDESPKKSTMLNSLADCLLNRFYLTLALEDLRQAGEVLQDSIGMVPNEDVGKAGKLDKLGRIFNFLYMKTGALKDINQAIQNGEQAVSLADGMHPSRSEWLIALGTSFYLRFKLKGSMEDLDQAIERTVEAATPVRNGGSANIGRFQCLVSYLRTQYQCTGDVNDSVQAVENEQEPADDEEVELHPVNPNGSPMLSVSVAVPEENIGTFHGNRHLGLERNTSTVLQLDEDTLSGIVELAYAHGLQFDQSGVVANLKESIYLYRWVLYLTPQSHSHQFTILNNLANALSTWFELGGSLGELEESIKLHRQTLDLRPVSHPDHSMSLNNLARSLHIQFEQKGDLGDLEESIRVYKQALDLRPGSHPGQPMSLSNLAGALSTQFKWKGDLGDLEESIKFHRQAVELTPVFHPHYSVYLHNLAVVLSIKFEQRGNLVDLEESVKLHRQALDLRPFPHPLQSTSLSNLASALSRQFEQKGDPGDLEESIILHRQALALRPVSHPDRPTSLNDLGFALLKQFEQKGDLGSLEECIECHRQAFDLTPIPHPNQPVYLHNLAVAHCRQFEQKGSLEDLEESIKLHRHALDLFPIPHPLRSDSLNNFAFALSKRFEQKGDIGDLEESIKFHRQALDLRPVPHFLRSDSLNNLANALAAQFGWKEDIGELEESIKLHREALNLRPVPHPRRSTTLNNLANGLYKQFQQKGKLRDLEESIDFHRQALNMFPVTHPVRPISLCNLASALFKQFQQKGDPADLKETIKFYRQALDLFPVPHPDRTMSVNNLASAFMAQFEQSRDLGDLKESINFHRQAIDLLPAPHPRRFDSLVNLANALLKQFEQEGNIGDLEGFITSCQEAVGYEFAPLVTRFQTSRLWAHHADSHQHSSALEAYETAMKLLPHLASLDMSLQQRQKALLHAGGLACNAASCAIQNNKMELAVEFLSAGRSVFWSQALHLRTPLDDLEEVYPELAQKLHSISNTLESASIRDNTDFISLSSQQKMVIEDQLSWYRKLNDEWIFTLKKVRQIEGFEDFLQPIPFSKLCFCATNGPVILLNATKLRCDGLIITLDGVKHVPLSNIDFSLVASLEKLLQRSLLQNDACFDDMSDIIENIQKYGHDQGHRGPYYGQNPDVILEIILECLWHCVVLPVITELQLQKLEFPSNRLWWCPTGPFVFLPIHAAGVYKYGETESMSNYCIPSYSSTLQDLLVPKTPSDPNFRMLAVIQPEIPGFPKLSLPGTIEELRRIEDHVPQPHDKYLVKLGDKSPATVTEVLKHLPNCSIAHFGCHGFQDPAKPLNSGLHLQDDHLKISELISCSVPKGSLAYLSACETAKGDASAPDEAMHITATMKFAGFHGVVGTMWPIVDEYAPKVADAFYRHLFQHGPNSDCTKAARALHLAVKELRDNDKSITFHHWVPFVHYGV